jgi:hypothetical protein
LVVPAASEETELDQERERTSRGHHAAYTVKGLHPSSHAAPMVNETTSLSRVSAEKIPRLFFE